MLQFEFNGHTSDEYNLIVTGISENDDIAAKDLQLGQKNKYRPRENHFGTIYNGNYSFVVGAMKNPCRNHNVIPTIKNWILKYDKTYTPTLKNGILTFPMNYTASIKNGILTSNNSDYLLSNDVRRINAWLTSPQYPKLFRFIDDEYFSEHIEFFATITEVNTEHTSLPYDLTFQVTCDAPWGYTPEITHNFTSSSVLTRRYTITNNSDCYEDYIYPMIKVSPKSHGTITIKNVTDDNKTMRINSLKNDDFYIDCQHLKIYDITNSLVTFEDLGISDVDDIYWPRLAYGDNIFEFTGDAEFEISYREPRKVGAFA